MIYLKCGDRMKKILKIIGIIFVVIYCLIAITLTVCLLNYNDYNITVLGDKTLIIVKDEELLPSYQKGDLIIVKKNLNREVNVGDKIFFYDEVEGQIAVNLGTVVDKTNITRTETTFVMNGDYPISSEYFIGKAETSQVIHKLGTVLSVLESRFGFLFLIIFPILVLFIYEIFVVIKEIKSPDEE